MGHEQKEAEKNSSHLLTPSINCPCALSRAFHFFCCATIHEMSWCRDICKIMQGWDWIKLLLARALKHDNRSVEPLTRRGRCRFWYLMISGTAKDRAKVKAEQEGIPGAGWLRAHGNCQGSRLKRSVDKQGQRSTCCFHPICQLSFVCTPWAEARFTYRLRYHVCLLIKKLWLEFKLNTDTILPFEKRRRHAWPKPFTRWRRSCYT